MTGVFQQLVAEQGIPPLVNPAVVAATLFPKKRI